MPQNKNKRELAFPQKTLDHQSTTLISAEGSVSLNEGYARRDDSSDFEKKFGLQDYFVSKEWHGRYFEAVCGSDKINRETILAEAERAIVGRFLELLDSAAETAEILDLQSAAYTITELRRANAMVYTPQHLVA